MLYPLAIDQIVVESIFIPLAIGAVALRFYARRKTKTAYLAADWTVLLCLVITVANCLSGLVLAATGHSGVPLETVSEEETSNVRRMYFVDVILCHTSFALIKISVIFFLKSIFTVPKFKLSANIFLAITVLWWITATICQIVSTSPISNFWTVPFRIWAKGYSFDYVSWLEAMAIVDLLLDVIIFLMPLFMIRSLKLKRQRKMQLMIVFGLAGFCIIASGIRLYWTQQFHLLQIGQLEPLEVTRIMTWNDLWSHIEALFSIFAISLPTLAPLFRSKSTQSPTYTYQNKPRSSGARLVDTFSQKRSDKSLGSRADWYEISNIDNQSSCKAGTVTGGSSVANGGITVQTTITHETV